MDGGVDVWLLDGWIPIHVGATPTLVYIAPTGHR